MFIYYSYVLNILENFLFADTVCRITTSNIGPITSTLAEYVYVYMYKCKKMYKQIEQGDYISCEICIELWILFLYT